MRWTKLKQRIEDRFAADLTGRLAIHLTRFRHAENGDVRLDLDGTTVYSTGYYEMLNARARQLGARNAISYWSGESGSGAFWDGSDFEAELTEMGHADDLALARALFASLDETVETMLASPHPLIRALGMADARLGKRRLARLDPAGEHDVVRRILGARVGQGLEA